MCKNIRHGRAGQRLGHAMKVIKVMVKSRSWDGRARLWKPFCCFCSECWHGSCMWWHSRAKVPAAFLSILLSKSPWIFLCNTLVIYFLGLKSVLGDKYSNHHTYSFIFCSWKLYVTIVSINKSSSLFIYFYVLLLLLYVYNEHEWVDFFVLGLLDEFNDLILIKPSLEP